MPRNRRRRDRDRRRTQHPHDVSQQAAPSETRAEATQAQPADVDANLPSTGARMAGVILAIVTFVIAAGVTASALDGDRAAYDVGLRLLAGIVLVALGIVIAALSIVPRMVRRLIWRY